MKDAIGVVLVGFVLLVGCGSPDPCGPSSCPNDVMATPAMMNSCRQLLDANKNSACYSQAYSYLSCQVQQRSCGSDGKTDENVTGTKITNNCKPQLDAAIQCCSTNKMATACQ